MTTAFRASPDLDNLEPSADSETRKLSMEEYVVNFSKSDVKFKGGGYLRIWGDYKSRRLEEYHLVSNVELLDQSTIQISFQSGNRLRIWKPETIFDAPTFMKVLKAERIKWEWYDNKNNKRYYYEYWVEGNGIRTKTDYDWKSYKIDTMLGDPAIFMYNADAL